MGGGRVVVTPLGGADPWMETKMPKMLLTALIAVGAISGLLLTTAAKAYNRDVEIINQSDQAILEFHASNVGENRWGPDLLGSSYLAPGDVAYVDLDDGTGYCRFDFLTVMEDRTSVVRPRVNVCEVASYTIE